MTRTNPFRIVGAILLLLASFMGLSMICGCQATGEQLSPEQRSYRAFVIAGEARSSMIFTLALLNEEGLIPVESWDEIDEAIAVTGVALRLWEQLLEAGEDTSEVEGQYYDAFDTLKSIRDPALEQLGARPPNA